MTFLTTDSLGLAASHSGNQDWGMLLGLIAGLLVLFLLLKVRQSKLKKKRNEIMSGMRRNRRS